MNKSEINLYSTLKEVPTNDTSGKNVEEKQSKNRASCILCRQTIGKNRALHKFPKNDKIKQAWMTACNIVKPKKYTYVCSEHFQPTDFFPKGNSKKIYLKPTSIPSVDLCHPKLTLPSISAMKKQRRIEAEHNQILNTQKTTNVEEPSKSIVENVIISQPFSVCPENNKEENEEQSTLFEVFVVEEMHISNKTEEKNKIVIEPLISNKQMNIVKIIDNDKNQSSNLQINNSKDIFSEFEKEINDLITNNKIDSSINPKIRAHLLEINEPQTENLLKFIKTDEELFAFCGIRFDLLDSITEAVSLFEGITDLKCLSLRDRICMTLCKLQLDLSYICLSVLFQINRRTCSIYVKRTIRSLAAVLKDIGKFPSKEHILRNINKIDPLL